MQGYRCRFVFAGTALLAALVTVGVWAGAVTDGGGTQPAHASQGSAVHAATADLVSPRGQDAGAEVVRVAPSGSETSDDPVSAWSGSRAASSEMSTAGAVDIWPGDDVNDILASNPEGKTFFMHAGTYSQLTLMPRSNQVIIGETGAILDGEGVATDGVGRAVANDVTIYGLEIRNYTGACVNWGADGWGRRWIIEEVEASYCKVGIVVKKGGTYRNNYVHHNEQYGMEGTGEWDLVVGGNEIAFNRTDTDYDPGDSGATKFHSTDGMILRSNYVHDNFGHGIWLDGPNTDAIIEDNLVVDNDEIGIFHELGYSPVIRNNVIEGNGFASDGSGGQGAGIYVFSTRDAEVSCNDVSGNRNGIAGRSDERGIDDNTGIEWLLENLSVHHNSVSMSIGATGVWDYYEGVPALQPAAGVDFADNAYANSPTDGAFFRWVDAESGEPGWQNRDLESWQFNFPADGSGDGAMSEDCDLLGPTCAGQAATHVGTPGQDTIVGGQGDDVIVALGGADTINGNGGDDVICAGGGADVVHGGKGSDKIFGQSGGDTLTGDGGDDVIYAGGGADVVHGGKGSDKIFGQSGGDTLTGDGGNDTLKGGKGTDTLYGKGGADVLKGNEGADTLKGQSGSDTIYGNKGPDLLKGGSWKDTLYGGGGADRLGGGMGSPDVCKGGLGTDVHLGGCETKSSIP